MLWNKRYWFDPWVGKIPCRKKWQPTSVFLPGESHGQRAEWAPVDGMQRAGPDRAQHSTNHTKEFGLGSNDNRELIKGFKKKSFMIRFFFFLNDLSGHLVENGLKGQGRQEWRRETSKRLLQTGKDDGLDQEGSSSS